MIGLGIYHYFFLPKENIAEKKVVTFKQTLDELIFFFKEFFQKKHIWYYIIFIILYRFAEGFAIKIVPLFLRASTDVGGLGLSEEEIR